jgi:hypothetical protein
MIALVSPLLQDDVLAVLLHHSQQEPPPRRCCANTARCTCSAATATSTGTAHGDGGRRAAVRPLDDAKRYLERTQAHKASTWPASCAAARRRQRRHHGFDVALKTLRRDTGKRKQLFTGMGGNLYLLSALRSGDPRHLKAAGLPRNRRQAAEESRQLGAPDDRLLRQIRAGVMQVDTVSTLAWEPGLQTQMFQFLLYFWLSLPQLQERKEQLQDLVKNAERAGYLFIAGQAAALLGHWATARCRCTRRRCARASASPI